MCRLTFVTSNKRAWVAALELMVSQPCSLGALEAKMPP